jgi:hypothetical protein
LRIMKSIIYKAFALLLIIGGSAACDDFGDMNVDPNEPTEVPAEGLATHGMFSAAYLYWDRNSNLDMGMLFAQHLAQAEYTQEQRYDFNATNFDFHWGTIYAGGYVGRNIEQGVLGDLREAKRLIMEDEGLAAAVKANQIAVLDILEAFQFQVATDIWGDIPYSEALQPDEFIQPRYDAQSSIYADLIATVSSAVASINTGAAGFSAGGDLIYGGDMDGWQKFGNALLLRMGMRVADVDPALAGSTVSAALAGNIYQAYTDEATLVFNENELTANPFWYNASPPGGSRDDHRISQEFLGTLQAMNDPRETLYADPTPQGTYVGMPYGLEDGPSFTLKASTSNFTSTLREATAPACLLRYSEVKFLTAEAIARGFTSGDAAAEYAAGVTAAMNEWGIMDQGAINAYIAAHPYDAANWDESIGMQMWIALYGNGLEAWATWRRLDYPELQVPEAALTDYIPVRGLYPTSEGATNSANLLAVPYEDAMSTKLWWDVN